MGKSHQPGLGSLCPSYLLYRLCFAQNILNILKPLELVDFNTAKLLGGKWSSELWVMSRLGDWGALGQIEFKTNMKIKFNPKFKLNLNPKFKSNLK